MTELLILRCVGVELFALLLFFGYIIYRLRKKLLAIEARSALSSDNTSSHDVVRAFFKKQVAASRHGGFPQESTPALRRYLCLLRCLYLGAEYKALSYSVNSQDYWVALERYLRELLKTLSDKPPVAPRPMDNAGFRPVRAGTRAMQHNTELLSEVVQRQKETIASLDKGLQKALEGGAGARHSGGW